VRDLLHAVREEGGGVVLISEDLDEVRSLADRLVVLYQGRIELEGDPSTGDRGHRPRHGGGGTVSLGFQLQRRLRPSLRNDILVPIVSVLAALVVGALFLRSRATSR
jgi:ABC-type multidrug transport system ATPase subunit